jgi:hypothetical protein
MKEEHISQKKGDAMNRIPTLFACLILAGLVLTACGPISIQLPEQITVPTELPAVIGTVAAEVAPPSVQPTSPPDATSQPVVVIPVTGNQPTGGFPIDSGTIIIALIALIALVSIVAMFSMTSRRRTESPESPPRTDRPPEGP